MASSITVCKFVVLLFNALFDGVVALRVILNVIPRRFVLRLCILGTGKRAGKEGGLSLATTLCHSLFSLPPLFSFGRILHPMVRVTLLSLSLFNFLSLSLTHVCELLPLFAHISSFFFASSISPLRERCLIQAAVYLAVS